VIPKYDCCRNVVLSYYLLQSNIATSCGAGVTIKIGLYSFSCCVCVCKGWSEA